MYGGDPCTIAYEMRKPGNPRVGLVSMINDQWERLCPTFGPSTTLRHRLYLANCRDAVLRSRVRVNYAATTIASTWIWRDTEGEAFRYLAHPKDVDLIMSNPDKEIQLDREGNFARPTQRRERRDYGYGRLYKRR